MDIVDTFNHLIPSDQLDDPILIGQNLECEANEFGSGLELEDSLKNMLSDKDPMFGSASSQFNLLDNEDSNFQIAGATGLDVGSTSSGLSGTAGAVTCAETAVVKRPVGRPRKKPTNLENEQSDGQETANLSTNTKSRGRPGRKPANKQLKSFLIEKGVKTAQLKKELYQGGRINIHNVDVGLWLNPVVVLRRLTVTVGGFRIELLPGPWENTGTGQPVCFEDGFTCGGDVEFAMVQEDSVNVQDDSVNVQDDTVNVQSDSVNVQNDSVNVQNPIPENVRDLGVPEKSCAEDAPPPLGPYVNPNDVQAANGTVTESPCLAETKLDNQSVSGEPKPASEGEGGATQPQDIHNNQTTPSNKMDSKEKQEVLAKKRLKSKQGPTSIKTKSLVPGSPSSMIKGPTVSQNTPSKTIQRGDVHNMKPLKREEKKSIVSLKRHGENVSSEPAAKVQRTQDTSPITAKPKSPGTSSSVVKRTLSSDSRPGEQQGLTKHAHSHVSPKPESAHLTQDTPAHSSKALDEGGPEKPKVKKPEKTLQKQKSKTARSISVDEPQLFIPDNAPIVKKETAEEQPANSDTMWDGNNNCGLCKKHHNNTFMVGCGRCDDWFHGDCVGLDLTKVREMMEEDQMYVCLKCCAEESTKVEPDAPSAAKPEVPAKHEVQDNKLPPKPRQGPSQSLTSGGVRPVGKESDRRQSTEVKDATQKTGVQVKQETKSKGSTLKKPVSVEEIRRSVRDSLKEILLQRLKESDLKIALEKASEVAKKTERELFHLYKDTDSKYKNKYRSLMFNLKDIKNNVLFKRVLRGEISPGNLIRMSPEELASKELAAWRQRENRHTIEMIEKEQRKTERRPITKITHKGEIEIESEEPAKVPETTEVELEPALKVTEEPAELLALESKSESTKTDKDTTNQHKSHLFDLHCKICTGRMAPPVEEAPVKVVKVATTVVRRQPTKMEETKRTPPPVKDDDLHLTVLEESFLNAKPSSNEPRSEYLSGRDKAFLSNLKSLWRGFLNMPAVAKLVTKSFPVSGVLDNLTEDLPDSIQVGGRITPQMVWDYLEKIRATGTKEVCLIRFSPETEEDEISYTLLYAYFSSRKRFGVVSNNLKQVKDMYLIPLGATEKVPHQLVPFDGPGLENNRGNLLLGLIIRQRPKRDFLPVDVTDAARIIPESKPLAVSTNDGRGLEDEKFYLSALTAVHTKEADKLLNSAEDVDEPITESFEETSVSEEGNNQESNKPLRFLPGVLLGWGGELPPLPDVGGKPVPAADDPQKTQVVPKADEGTATKSPTAATTPRDRFVIKKKEPKAVKAEPELPGPTDTSIANSLSGKDVAVVTHGASVSLKDKPTDVSTEAFLASLSTTPTGNEANSAVSANKGDVGLLSDTENGKPEGNSSLKPQAATDHTHTSKPPLSGILKKCSAYSSVSEEKQTEVAPKDDGSQPAPLNPQPVPVLSSTRNDPVLVSHHGYSHLSQAEHRPGEEVQSNISSSHSEREDPGTSQAAPMVTPTVYLPSVQGPQAASYAPAHTEATGFQYDSVMAPAIPTYNNAAPFPPQQQQPQVPGSYDYPIGPPSNTFPTPQDPRDQNHATQWAQESAMASQAPPGLQYPDSYAESSGQPPSLGKDYKRLEDQYSDPWERPRHTEDRDHYGRHSHRGDSHHGKKSRHHDRERGKRRERSHEDKYKERSRHHGHSEERHGERRKERHHSDDHSSRHKDRHRSRRDSDYENGRRSSKDSYS